MWVKLSIYVSEIILAQQLINLTGEMPLLLRMLGMLAVISNLVDRFKSTVLE